MSEATEATEASGKAADAASRDGRATPLAVRPVKSAYEQVADQLRNLILSGRLAPGDRLPIEAELTTQFGVSRSTVREALRVLSSQNLITTTRGVGGGSVVAFPDEDLVSDFLEAKIGLLTGVEKLTVDNLLEARTLLEVPAAGFAAERRTDEQLAALSAYVADSGEDLRPEVHMEFHRELLNAAGNPLVRLMTAPVFRVLQVRFLRDNAPERFWYEVEEDHLGILRAIAAQDRDEATRLMSEHLAHLRGTYRAIERP